MEAIDVELGDFALRRRSLLVSHARAALARGLEPGEQVVLHDRVRGCWTARVADLDFEPTDTVYRLEIGSRPSAQEAHERVLGRTSPVRGRLTKKDLIDLLGQLRATSPSSPFGLPGQPFERSWDSAPHSPADALLGPPQSAAWEA